MQMAAVLVPLGPGPLLGHGIATIQLIGMGFQLRQERLVVALLLSMVIRPGDEFSGCPLATLQQVAAITISHG